MKFIASKYNVKIFISDFVEMSNDLWFHALRVLDNFRTSSEVEDVFKLYEFQDESGILSKHKEHLETMFNQEKVDVKIVYFELIKMLMDQDKKERGIEGFRQTKDVEKIQGFQELTNRYIIINQSIILHTVGELKDLTLHRTTVVKLP